MTAAQRAFNKYLSGTRARVEHAWAKFTCLRRGRSAGSRQSWLPQPPRPRALCRIKENSFSLYLGTRNNSAGPVLTVRALLRPRCKRTCAMHITAAAAAAAASRAGGSSDPDTDGTSSKMSAGCPPHETASPPPAAAIRQVNTPFHFFRRHAELRVEKIEVVAATGLRVNPALGLLRNCNMSLHLTPSTSSCTAVHTSAIIRIHIITAPPCTSEATHKNL